MSLFYVGVALVAVGTVGILMITINFRRSSRSNTYAFLDIAIQRKHRGKEQVLNIPSLYLYYLSSLYPNLAKFKVNFIYSFNLPPK
jgi:hypothetical protein